MSRQPLKGNKRINYSFLDSEDNSGDNEDVIAGGDYQLMSPVADEDGSEELKRENKYSSSAQQPVGTGTYVTMSGGDLVRAQATLDEEKSKHENKNDSPRQSGGTYVAMPNDEEFKAKDPRSSGSSLRRRRVPQGSGSPLSDDEAVDSDLLQGSRDEFKKSQRQMRQTLKGQTSGYGLTDHATGLQEFFGDEIKRMTLANTPVLNPFIQKYRGKLQELKLNPTPAQFVDFLEMQEFERDNSDSLAQPILADFLEREEDYLITLVGIPEAEEAKKQQGSWYWTKKHAFHITGTVAGLGVIGMLAWLIIASRYSSHLVSVEGDYPDVFARFANKDNEQDQFMHKTLIAGGIGLALGTFFSGVVAGYQVVKHWVQAPLEKAVDDLKKDNRDLRLQVDDLRRCVQHTPVPKPVRGHGLRLVGDDNLGGGRSAADPYRQMGPIGAAEAAQKARERSERLGDIEAEREDQQRQVRRSAPQPMVDPSRRVLLS